MVYVRLTLTLLVLGIFTDNHDLPVAFDDFALFANFLDRRSDFHLNTLLTLLGTPCYAAAGEVIWRHFNRHLVSG